jgi:hypothetical protein
MEKNAPDLVFQPLFRPVGMLGSHPGGFDVAREPIELLSQSQPALAWHGTEYLDLFGTGWFIRQHEERMRPKTR